MASASANCIEPLHINSHSLLFTWDQRPERRRHTPPSRISQINLVSFLCWWKVGVRGGGGVKKCPPSAISHLSVGGGNVIDWNWMEWIGNEVLIDGLSRIITCHNPVTFHRELPDCVGYYSPVTNTSIVLTTSGLLLHLSDNFNIDVKNSNSVWLVHGRIDVNIKNSKLFCLRCKFFIVKSAKKFAKGSSDQKIHGVPRIFNFLAGLLKIIVITQLLRKKLFWIQWKKYSLLRWCNIAPV